METFLSEVFKNNVHFHRKKKNEWVLYDVLEWNNQIQDKILYKYPHAEISMAFDTNSLSGFSIYIVLKKKTHTYIIGVFLLIIIDFYLFYLFKQRSY
jgi:hypothetical protein